MKRIIAMSYYGGKFSHLKHLLPWLPEDVMGFCEPFGGSAAVLLNRKPCKVETYNDLNGELVNFFRMLREQPNELIRLLALTPYSREEFVNCLGPSNDYSSLERARRMYVRVMQSRDKLPNCPERSSAWSYGCDDHSASLGWSSKMIGLYTIAERFHRVQIECLDALDCIKRYDRPNVLIYCDPPYLSHTRMHQGSYGDYEMSLEQHRELAKALNRVKGLVAISGYKCPEMSHLYSGWVRVDFPERSSPASDTRTKRVESLWMNYDYEPKDLQ
jgi:DNA adenine methylase